MEKYNLLKNNNNSVSTEIQEIRRKRRFTAAYKKKVIELASKCNATGEMGALLRKEGLSSSTVYGWRVAHANGALRGSRTKRRGPTPTLNKAQKETLAKVQRENASLKRRVERAEALVDLQKKIAELLNISPV